MNRRTLLASACALAAIQTPAWAQDMTDVTIMYTATAPFAAVYVAADAGLFAANGINAALQLAQNGSVVLSGVISNSAQVGLPTPTVVLQAVDNGIELRALAASNIFPDEGVSGLVARPDAGIETPADLAGKKVGVPGIGALLDVTMRKWVDENGGDSSAINIVEIALPQTADILSSGQVDAVASVDPFSSRAVDLGAGVLIGNYLDVVPEGSAGAIVTVTAEWAEQNPEAVAGIQRALRDAAKIVQTDPDATRAAIANYTTLPPPVVANVAMPNVTSLELTADTSLGFWQEVALEQDLIMAPVDLDALIVPFPAD